jgi:phosphatidate cytidylyltransferase
MTDYPPHSPSDAPQEEPHTGQPVLSNLAIRVVTAIVLLPAAMFALFTGGIVLMLLIAPFAIVGALEFYLLARGHPYMGRAVVGVPAVGAVLLAFYAGEPLLALAAVVVAAALVFGLQTLQRAGDVRLRLWQTGITLAGIFYVGFPLAFLIALRALPDGLLWLLLIVAATWGTDTFAYIGGRLWGQRRLAPRLSPKKTVEGAVVGYAGGWLLAFVLLAAENKVNILTFVMISVAPIMAILGDLLESALKRFFGVKDSRVAGLNLIPGHGGVLDRIDSLILVTVFVYTFIHVIGVIV